MKMNVDTAGKRMAAWLLPSIGAITRRPLLLISATVLMAIVAMAIAPSMFTALDPNQQNVMMRLKPPMVVGRDGITHMLGTDQIGRDIWTRIVYAARPTLLISLAAVTIALSIGVGFGALGGYVGGIVDSIILRLIDMQLSFPVVLLVIGVVSITGSSNATLVVLMGIASWPAFARVVRSEVMVLREKEFVEAARSLGASHLRIVARHILPNVVASVMVLATFELSTVMLVEATLSFLGVGVQPPTPTWGGMINEAHKYLNKSWTASLFPGIVISLVILAINTVGDEIRDLLDPKLRRSKR